MTDHDTPEDRVRAAQFLAELRQTSYTAEERLGMLEDNQRINSDLLGVASPRDIRTTPPRGVWEGWIEILTALDCRELGLEVWNEESGMPPWTPGQKWKFVATDPWEAYRAEEWEAVRQSVCLDLSARQQRQIADHLTRTALAMRSAVMGGNASRII